MTFAGPFKRIETGRGHRYTDANGVKIPGVTTIINQGVPKPALVNWAARTAAEYAVDNWTELWTVGAAERLRQIGGAPNRRRNAAAARGTLVHAYAEKLAHGEEVEVPDEVRGHVESCLRFLDEFQAETVVSESTCYSVEFGYAGTFDIIVDLPGIGRYLCDWKTNASGIYGDVALQLAAYRFADFYDDDVSMLLVDGCAVIHIQADSYTFRTIEANDAAFDAFLAAQTVAEFRADADDFLGPILTPGV